ncbi:flagellar motor protein MotB [Sphingomonas nostoxanthinifaciens]|uniref:flagellar motor protein MotB n=1 Tax=Sphingomonas nostoxanthinifaciens TaxID=2872652 RepID=UPI001CC2141D|nr:flagellar motor protein MotB [Sphingomonas nostoxanthinifaciens]UAK26066.1 OmpA family protein [Sphingomonas nostoxanthinifaciens]
MAAPAKRGKNEPEPRPIIVKKIIVEGHGGHHGGAWKVAYADFVTAMMAFFLLLWILGATTEKQRKGIADYFAPTMVQMKQKSAGSNGVFGGDSIVSKDHYAHKSAQTGSRSLTIPKDASGGVKEGEAQRVKDRIRFGFLKRELMKRIQSDKSLQRFAQNIRMTETREGLRIDLVDKADFSMFAIGTDRLLPDAFRLMGQVAQVISAVPNGVIVRGHTDSLPYAAGRSVNNWTLSSARAEATRRALAEQGVAGTRFSRIEGVADREPFVPTDRYDPRNRRMSVTLEWSDTKQGDAAGGDPQTAGVADSIK